MLCLLFARRSSPARSTPAEGKRWPGGGLVLPWIKLGSGRLVQTEEGGVKDLENDERRTTNAELTVERRTRERIMYVTQEPSAQGRPRAPGFRLLAPGHP